METEMSFKELKEKEFELNRKRIELIAKQSSMSFSKRWYKKEYNQQEYDKVSDEIYQIDDLLVGIKSKIRKEGFEYEYIIQSLVPNNFNELQLWSSIKTIILEKNYPTPLNNNDLIEFIILIDKNKDEELISIRKINKY